MIRYLLFVFLLSGAQLLQAQDATKLELADARHLLTRTGFGASPTELNELLNLSREQAVDKILSGLHQAPQSSLPEWVNNKAPNHWARQELSQTDRSKFNMARRNEIQSLRLWWIQEMISTPNPQTERLTLFWHNHFATGYSAINDQSLAIARQHLMLRQHSSGNFRTLLNNIIRDPAMLNYLDNNGSRKKDPNENLARELLELFTLGEGNYTENDIKNAARALTGYSFSEVYDQRFVFHHWDHDDRKKTLFKQTGKFDGDDLIDLILAKPETATYITAKFWRAYIGDISNDNSKLAPHAAVFRNSDYDIKSLYRSLLLSADFWAKSNRATIVQSPVSLTIGAIRSTGILPKDWQTLPNKLAQMGQQLFDPPNVAGWPGGETWITPGRLLTRLEWLENLTSSSTGVDSPVMDMTSMRSMPAGMTSMANANTMQAMANSMTANSNQLSVRMASEMFGLPAKYVVDVYAENTLLWSSGQQALPGGHDTKRMGRINQNNMPWQSIAYPVDFSKDQIDAIEISFINDGKTNAGADRNLYISRATMDGRTWLPSDGEQTGKCARKKPKQRGNLYCNGKLRLEKYTDNAIEPNTQLPDNIMQVSGAYLSFARPPKRKPHSDITFTLSDVVYKGRQWDTMNVKYVKNKDGYAIWMSNYDCWPKCFEKPPACAWKSKPMSSTLPTAITTSLALGTKKPNLTCMYNGLTQPDKDLANALWSLVDDFYAIGANSYKMRRPKIAKNYNSWAPHIEKMQQLVSGSFYSDKAIKLQIEPRRAIDITLSEVVLSPTPAGISNSERQVSLQNLKANAPSTNLLSLLLPTSPISSNNSNTLSAVITDLAFQLK